MTEPVEAVLVYDGACGFCTASALWIARHWQLPARAVAWQKLGAEGLRALGITREEARDAAWWIDASGRRSRGHLAIARSLAAADGWRSILGRVLLVPPLHWIAWTGYRLATSLRHRIPVGTRACGRR